MKKSTDAIQVTLAKGHVPASFRWRGQNFRVHHIERIWRSTTKRNNGTRTYRVRSRRHAFLLRHDPRQHQWKLVRSPLRIRLSLFLTGFASKIAA